MGFPQGQKDFMCDPSRVKQQMKYFYTCFLEAFFFDCCYCNTLCGWRVWALNHS